VEAREEKKEKTPEGAALWNTPGDSVPWTPAKGAMPLWNPESHSETLFRCWGYIILKVKLI